MKWTLEACQAAAKKFTTRSAWHKAKTGYSAAVYRGWLDICCAHMTRLRNPGGYWTLEKCQAEAKRYKTRWAWQKAKTGGYYAALRRGWLSQCCEHMIQVQKPNGYWTLERCLESAKQHSLRSAWERADKAAHCAAIRRGWYKQCCAHMECLRMPKGYWTYEACLEDAKKYTTHNAWRRANPGAYKSAKRNKWLTECCAHMVLVKKPKNYWTLARCIEMAKQYESRGAWQKAKQSGYLKAYRNGWLDICCAHMEKSKTAKRQVTAVSNAQQSPSSEIG